MQNRVIFENEENRYSTKRIPTCGYNVNVLGFYYEIKEDDYINEHVIYDYIYYIKLTSADRSYDVSSSVIKNMIIMSSLYNNGVIKKPRIVKKYDGILTIFEPFNFINTFFKQTDEEDCVSATIIMNPNSESVVIKHLEYHVSKYSDSISSDITRYLYQYDVSNLKTSGHHFVSDHMQKLYVFLNNDSKFNIIVNHFENIVCEPHSESFFNMAKQNGFIGSHLDFISKNIYVFDIKNHYNKAFHSKQNSFQFSFPETYNGNVTFIVEYDFTKRA